MSGSSTISVLYRGVFVQEFTVPRLWGIQGSIDVDPKHFKPRLNREGFVGGPFEAEVKDFLTAAHPQILKSMAGRISHARAAGTLDKWAAKRWATLWLSIPRTDAYADVFPEWDRIFRAIPAFEVAVGNRWEPISLDQLLKLERPFYVVPLREDKHTEVHKTAIRLLRLTKRTVIHGLQADRQWLRDARNYFSTTADLIANVFSNEIPPLVPVKDHAEQLLQEVGAVATLYAGAPPVELVRIGTEGPPILRLSTRLIINIDNELGKAIVRDAIASNTGRWSLIAITARHSYAQLSEVAASIRDSTVDNERIGLVKSRYIRGLI